MVYLTKVFPVPDYSFAIKEEEKKRLCESWLISFSPHALLVISSSPFLSRQADLGEEE